MAASAHAPGRTRRTTVGGTRAITDPKKLAPRSSISPRYSSQRPPIAARDGPDELVSAAPGVEPLPEADGVVPSPNANEPVARWPSTADTVRQATVYTPPGNV